MQDTKVIVDHTLKVVQVLDPHGGTAMIVPFSFIDADIGISASMMTDAETLDITLLDIHFSSIEVVR